MELGKLLHNVGVLDMNADINADIRGIKINSNTVENGDIFVCMEGVNDDGNDYIDSIKVPFIALTEKKPTNPNVKYVLVGDARKAYAVVCQNYFSNPANDMKTVAIVGTNGKTSTAHYLVSLLTFAGIKCGLIGTEGHYIDGEKVGQSLTTPDPYELNELMSKMRAKGCEVVVSEVSAHAIYLEKTGDIRADIAILTNITQDHLDFFKDFDNYVGVKMSYFTKEHVKKAIINVDDRSGRLLLQRSEISGLPCISYGLNNPADCFAVNVRDGSDGVQFVANLNDDIVDCKTKLIGEFNVYNLLAALAAAKELGIDGETLSRAVKKVKSVKGRFSVMRNDKGTIIIDFAHTPDSLKQLLSTARTLTKSRLITVFGCGGERDVLKRKKMGEVASYYSDCIVLTSDNPRGENPSDIIRDIESGVNIKDVKSIENRYEAVRFALSEMEEGDTLVIAGKGNENYLEVRGRKLPYSDFDVVERYGQLR
ncbi:MAG: UDP-N-acetylmuramoyl-L-alanyl-D-glutamate--2,6-diaminopimelate ligase [Bacteroides sp.]|nr:UDP-N-acetylmuramoyl-L-alanyl-D-glutamate--2,6-diaminopimelate ligase [Bacillota bacterium]MCM1394366.1 UDP-N-acetylmuramoyl-L-alanyl-D-glutamate--2,6-diaminopimelate ligase [[Eubacterium] siraeum]MCM1455033.1 UDP-N-acetylmuramoyl-L-alanyl-D-glutamate--2,6-diaminopimelate ligase [Bacteroides sp.]